MKFYKDKYFNFIEIFNEKNGFLLRSNIINEKGEETQAVPYKRSYPELIDIGIMGHCQNEKTCRNFGVDCYQGNKNVGNMDLDLYKSIIDQSKGYTYQVALGGKGDPNKHEKFGEILKYTVEHGIIPNLTTSGVGITEYEINLILKYCGAIAISMYSKYNKKTKQESNPECINLINKLSSKIKTNIHYVVSNSTIDDLIYRLENKLIPEKINSLILLLYKPVGYGKEFLKLSNIDKIKKLFGLLHKEYPFKIGFDSCFAPLVRKYMSDLIVAESLIPCEAGRFSCYIDSNMMMYPCSFAQLDEYGSDLTELDIFTVWFSNKFLSFIKKCNGNCDKCPVNLNEHILSL